MEKSTNSNFSLSSAQLCPAEITQTLDMERTISLIQQLHACQTVNFNYLKLRLAYLKKDWEAAKQVCTLLQQSQIHPTISFTSPEEFLMLLLQLEKVVSTNLKFPQMGVASYDESLTDLNSIKMISLLMEEYKRLFPTHLLIISEKGKVADASCLGIGPIHRTWLTVEGAEEQEVNGVYHFKENCSGAGFYFQRRENYDFALYRLCDNYWYIKRASFQHPECFDPNASQERFLYKAKSRIDQHLPPTMPNSWWKTDGGSRASGYAIQKVSLQVTIHNVSEEAIDEIMVEESNIKRKESEGEEEGSVKRQRFN